MLFYREVIISGQFIDNFSCHSLSVFVYIVVCYCVNAVYPLFTLCYTYT